MVSWLEQDMFPSSSVVGRWRSPPELMARPWRMRLFFFKEGQYTKNCFPQTPIDSVGITALKEPFPPLPPKFREVSLRVNTIQRRRWPAVEMQLHPRILRPWAVDASEPKHPWCPLDKTVRLKLFSVKGRHCQTALCLWAAQCRLHEEHPKPQLAVLCTNTGTIFVKKAEWHSLLNSVINIKFDINKVVWIQTLECFIIKTKQLTNITAVPTIRTFS
jgi:hypothetical protein